MGVFVKFLLHLDSFVDDSCVTQNLSDDTKIFPVLLCVLVVTSI